MNLSCEPDQVFPFPSSLSDLVTDMDFSPFDECLLATCSGDETVSFPSFPLFIPFLLVLLVYACTQINFPSSGAVLFLARLWIWLVLLFKPFEDSLLSAYYPQPQVSKLSGICWLWVCIFRLSSLVYLRGLSKHTCLLLHTDRQHLSGLHCTLNLLILSQSEMLNQVECAKHVNERETGWAQLALTVLKWTYH